LEEDTQTRFCLTASLLLLCFGLCQARELQQDAVRKRQVMQEKCSSAALHKLGAVGHWDDDEECCTVRMRFEDHVGPTRIYEEDVPLNQLPPPRA
jgi:hypothetical protein